MSLATSPSHWCFPHARCSRRDASGASARDASPSGHDAHKTQAAHQLECLRLIPMSPTIPQYHELMWPVLTALKELGGSATIKEMYDRVVEDQQFSEDQQSISTKDGRMSEIEYRLHWARTHLKGIGAATNSARGVWTITQKGREITPALMEADTKIWRAEIQASHCQELWTVAVGTALGRTNPVTGGPPHRSQRAELPHWAPASGGGGEAHLGIRMHDAGGREPAGFQPLHASPGEPVLLAAAT